MSNTQPQAGVQNGGEGPKFDIAMSNTQAQAGVQNGGGGPKFDFEAAPDVEIFLDIVRGDDIQQKEACVNISRSILELKQSLSEPLGIAVRDMEIRKGDTLLNDNMLILEYQIECDDTITIKDNSQ